LKNTDPSKLAFAFDESLESCFRNRIYPDYKSSRGLPDENLAMQLKACRKLTEALGIACFSSKRYEADDLIGSLVWQFRNKVSSSVILTRDKDLGQLLRKNDELWDYAADERTNSVAFRQKFGVVPEMFADYLALVGDTSDDIPGVQGLGPKAASVLINKLGNIESIYEQLDSVSELPLRGALGVRNALERDRELAFISKRLAEIRCDLKLVNSFSELSWVSPSEQKLKRMLTRYKLQGKSRKAIENAFKPLF
jgi:5'-3' exonuclease